jgi:hypothetical protein
MEFTDKELQIIRDREFLLTKSVAISKTHELLVGVQSELRKSVHESDLKSIIGKNQLSGKISKGENYRRLPYMVLDYPAIFSKEDIFAYRTMFWWGNFFSCTLHLQGSFLLRYRKHLSANIEQLASRDTFICVNSSPWEYHYEADNYKLLQLSDLDVMNRHPFLKISKRIELKDWKNLPIEANKFIKVLLSIIE